MKKVIILGGGLSGVLVANLLLKKKYEIFLLERHSLTLENLKLYYKLKKKNLHAHSFSSMFCFFLKKYLPEIYWQIQKGNKYKNKIFEKFFINNINLTKVELHEILLKNILNKIKYYNNVNNINFQKEKLNISDIVFEIKGKKNQINNVDIIFDCTGTDSYFESELTKNNNLDVTNIPNNSNILTFIFEIKDDMNLKKLNNLLLNQNITIYENNYNLSLIKYGSLFSASFVTINKNFLDREIFKKILLNYLKKNDVDNIAFRNNLKWSHFNSKFIKYKSLSKCVENLFPIGDSFMKTNPEYGMGSTSSLLQSIYISKNSSEDLKLDSYLELFFKYFKLIEEVKSKRIKLGEKNILKKILPYYMQFRFLYSFFRERKKFKKIIKEF
tara:strand:- start:558 stop:1712 length:1155 start_codon:yes stop_codon:yes gene_type:complete